MNLTSSTIWLFAIPVIFLFYAFRMLIQKPAFGNGDGVLPFRRVKESEDIWNYIQRTAGVICLVLAVVSVAYSYVLLIMLKGNTGAYWAAIALDAVCVIGIVPFVNMLVDKRFPKKKRK